MRHSAGGKERSLPRKCRVIREFCLAYFFDSWIEQSFDLLFVHVVLRYNRNAGVYIGFERLTGDRFQSVFNALIAHSIGILQDQGINSASSKAFDLLRVGVERNQYEVIFLTRFRDGARCARTNSVIVGKEAEEIVVCRNLVSGRVHRLSHIAVNVYRFYQFDVGGDFFYPVDKALVSVGQDLHARHIADDANFSLQP